VSARRHRGVKEGGLVGPEVFADIRQITAIRVVNREAGRRSTAARSACAKTCTKAVAIDIWE
jgi:hypothetical protein